jgi:elongation factor Ts
MPDITVSLINDLRSQTNAGMMDCKKALIENNGDMAAAIKQLREKGLAIQVKRADKESNQGIIKAAVSADGKTIALVEVNCETDFVAKTDKFMAFVASVADRVLAGDLNVVETMKQDLAAILTATGENVKIRRVSRYAASGKTAVSSYIHMGGKVGVMVEVEVGDPAAADKPEFQSLIHDLCLQAAAAAPRWLDRTEVPAADIETEKDIYRKQVEGKPANIVENILKGKIEKFFADTCLINQAFVKEPKMSITQLVDDTAKAIGTPLAVKRFARFQLGAA